MKFQFLTENFSRSENAPPFETRKIRHFEVERIFLENKKMVQELRLILRMKKITAVCLREVLCKIAGNGYTNTLPQESGTWFVKKTERRVVISV